LRVDGVGFRVKGSESRVFQNNSITVNVLTLTQMSEGITEEKQFVTVF